MIETLTVIHVYVHTYLQFDLDEHFASEGGRLAQLTNKCTTDDDVDYYIKEAGEVCHSFSQPASMMT